MVVNNPNNWHWVDKNCIDWAKQYFNDNLVGILAKTEDGRTVKVSSVSSLEGDVEVCQRKGKVISLFDLRVIMNIDGLSAPGKEFKGSITVPELAYDTEEEEIQFDVSMYHEDTDSEKMRPVTRKELVPQLRKVLLSFGTDLIAAHASDIQLDQEKVQSVLTKENQKGAGVKAKPATPKVEARAQSATQSKPNTSTLHLEPVFNTTAEQLYITLLDGQRIAAWTRSNPQIESFPPKEGSEFKFFGGSISGKFVKLVSNEHITQLWRLDNWREGHYATLDIQLKQGAGETTMVVKWSGIPVGEEDRVRNNFEDYYIRSIKITFGFGAVL